MIQFLFKIWGLARAYRLRLALGVFCGVLTGLAEPLLLVTVVLVFKFIFPSAQDETVNEQMKHLMQHMPTVAKWLTDLQQAIPTVNGRPTMAWTVLIVSAIPSLMLVRGLVTYLNAYLMNWVAIRAISDLRARF